jgi:glutathione S-transferase
MPVYKLHYFNNPRQGRAELSRLILSQAGVEFQDIRFAHCEWPAIKPSKLFLSFRFVKSNLFIQNFSFH